jgi:hypothetical protein
MTMTSSSLRSSAKPRSDNNNDKYNDGNKDKDVVIANVSRNNDDHDVIFFVPVVVAVLAMDKDVICPQRYPLTSTPLRRRRGGDSLSSKLRSNGNNGSHSKDNEDTVIASMSKNYHDHNVVFFAPVVCCSSR